MGKRVLTHFYRGIHINAETNIVKKPEQGQKKMAYFKEIKRLISDQNGATAIEYGLLVALIAMVCVTTIYSLGNVSGGYENTSAALQR